MITHQYKFETNIPLLKVGFIIAILWSSIISNSFANDIKQLEKKGYEAVDNSDFKRAILYFKNTKSGYHKQKKFDHSLENYTNIGVCFYYLNELDSATQYLNLGIVYAKEQGLLNSTVFGELKRFEGVVHEANGDYKKAINATKISLNILKGDVTTYNNLAAIYRRFADYDTALYYYDKALKLKPNDATVLHNIGVVYEEMGLHQKAIRYFKNNISITNNKADEIDTYTSLSSNYIELGNCDYAFLCMQKAEELLYLEYDYIDVTYQGIASVYACKKQYKKATEYQEKTIQTRIESLGKEHPLTGKAYKEKATIYTQQNNHKEALKTYKLALKTNLSNPDLLEVLVGQAKSKTALKHNKKDILKTYLDAIDLIDTMRVHFAMDGSKYHLLEKSIPIYESAIGLAIELGEKALAFKLSEKSKAGVLLEAMQQLNAKKYLQISDDKDNQTHAEFMAKVYEEYPDYYGFKHTLTVNDIQQSLNRNQALVAYFVGQEKTYTFIIDQQNIDVQSFKTISNATISTFISNLKESSCDYFQDYTKLGHELYEQLLAPISSLENYNNLILIPDAELSFIPFEALLTSPSNVDHCRYDFLPYLLKKYSVNYAYSANLWLENKRKKTAISSHKIGGFAPSFSGKSTPQRNCDDATISDLKHNKKSVQAICKFQNDSLFLDDTASLNNFKNNAKKFDILHLATHACSDRIFFSDSALLSSEIYNLPLNAKLAVLSACETGTGHLQRGEGVMSLARAFTYAGCPSVVMSLWSVDDESTKDIMVDFYKNLLDQGLSQDEALRKAKLNYLDSIKGYADANPYYWAAFVQIGDAESLDISSGNEYWKWILIIIFGGMMALVFMRKRND